MTRYGRITEGSSRATRSHLFGIERYATMVCMPDTRARVRVLVEKVAGKAVPDDPEESLFESGVLDSFKLPDLVSALEQEFSIQVSDADLRPRNFDSLARIEEYLAARS